MGEAQIDGLSGLPGKQDFDEALQRLIPSPSSDEPVSLAFFDIDHFLHVNERYGRDSGDEGRRICE